MPRWPDRGRSSRVSETICAVAVESERALHGRWVHSYEEDTENELIFRPTGHPFPPSRGRMSLELRPDGTYVQAEPGPTDAPQESTGKWSLDGDRLVLHGEHGGQGQAWRVVSAGEDGLRIRR